MVAPGTAEQGGVAGSLTYFVKIALPDSLLAQFEDACDAAGVAGVSSWGLLGDDRVDIAVYCDGGKSAEAVALLINDVLADIGAPEGLLCSVEAVPTEDWQNAWKKHFKAARVSDRVVVRPSWEEWCGSSECLEVVIDPGMTFGTGLHPTTRACIRFLDKCDGSGKSFLDAGCGSGILSVAAAKLGYRPVRAFDVDPMAVKCCKDNLLLNSVGGGAIVECASVGDFMCGETFDFVAVNILAPVILEHAERISSLVARREGLLALAGIREEQFGAVRGTFEGLGFECVEQIDEDEWKSGLFKS